MESACQKCGGTISKAEHGFVPVNARVNKSRETAAMGTRTAVEVAERENARHELVGKKQQQMKQKQHVKTVQNMFSASENKYTYLQAFACKP